jgi:hypothetical protein
MRAAFSTIRFRELSLLLSRKATRRCSEIPALRRPSKTHVEGDPNLDGILLGTSEAPAGAETSGSVEGDPNLEGRVSVEGEADATATGVDSAVVAPATGADSAVVVQAVGAGAKGSSTKGNKGAAAGVPLPAEVATALAVLLIASDCV